MKFTKLKKAVTGLSLAAVMCAGSVCVSPAATKAYSYSPSSARIIIYPYGIVTADHVDFVINLYNKCLGRSASPSEIDYWAKRLASGQMTASDVVRGFFESTEFQNKRTNNTQYVERLYRAVLRREPDGYGKAYWIGALDGGCSRYNVLKGFTNSTEFTNLCRKYGFVRGSL